MPKSRASVTSDTGPAKVPPAVLAQLEAIRSSGEISMSDYARVVAIAFRRDYHELLEWSAVPDNHRRYSEGIFYGFEVAPSRAGAE
jgi:hypothetical protein